MPRRRRRVCLESGLKLDINNLVRQGSVVPGACSACHMFWRNSYSGEETASATITANMMSKHEGYLRIQIQGLEQMIILTPRPRGFGGNQWYFMCPFEDRCCSVLWRPMGAKEFRCRQAWGKRVAYASQFLDPDNRAHRGNAKIKQRLIADSDPDEWDLPPKPKWMRWATYDRFAERFDHYEASLGEGLDDSLAKLSQEDLT